MTWLAALMAAVYDEGMGPYAILARNLETVRERIAAAAERSGRRPSAVTLVAVSKYVDADVTRALIRAGATDIGESRPQQLWHKAEALAYLAPRWHMIGHVQRNKAERTAPLLAYFHSCDSLRLMTKIAQARSRHAGAPLPALIEINVSGDETKHGFEVDQAVAALDHALALQGFNVRGLMAMSGIDSDSLQARREFAALRELRDRLLAKGYPAASLHELSMGMTRDFEAAIEEGATMVRIGSALFEGV